jgi:formylglycine-generating enzyme required for sulfatase activity
MAKLFALVCLALVTVASAQTRTMSINGTAAVGFPVTFVHQAPTTSAGSFVLHALTPHYTGVFPLQIPGLSVVGTTQIDAGQVWLHSWGALPPTGMRGWRIEIPFNSMFVGVTFDVQSLDIDSTTNTLHWAQSDAELMIANFAPPSTFNMVPISAGTFQMGSTAGQTTEQPIHAVTITRPFWCCKYEVTQMEYLSVRLNNPSQFQGASYPNFLQRPVERVSWYDAMVYCATLTASEAVVGRLPAGYQYRLPTEAECEYICRAGTVTEWNTGASLGASQANFGSFFAGQTTVVGSYGANPWGLFDTHGNVWEWCLDSWDGTANYPSSAVSDPYVSIGPYRSVRGGSYYDPAVNCRSAIRNVYNPGFSGNFVGFRVVLAPILVR